MSTQSKPTKSHAGLPPFSKEYLANEHDAKTFGQPKPTTGEPQPNCVVRNKGQGTHLKYRHPVDLDESKPTSEWTLERLSNYRDPLALANDINAELTAEREKVEFQNKVIKQHKEALHRQQEQLASEREKVDRDALDVTVAFNRMRSAMVALDNLLHAQHNRRHPVPKPVLDLTPSQPLDPVTRAEIDATP